MLPRIVVTFAVLLGAFAATPAHARESLACREAGDAIASAYRKSLEDPNPVSRNELVVLLLAAEHCRGPRRGGRLELPGEFAVVLETLADLRGMDRGILALPKDEDLEKLLDESPRLRLWGRQP